MASVYIAHTCQKPNQPYPCHPWTKKSRKLVSNLRKEKGKQPYIWAVNGTAAMSRCVGASRAKIETSRSLCLKCIKRLCQMTVTVATIWTNIRIPSLRVSCLFGGVARFAARERTRDCDGRRGKNGRSRFILRLTWRAIIGDLARRLLDARLYSPLQNLPLPVVLPWQMQFPKKHLALGLHSLACLHFCRGAVSRQMILPVIVIVMSDFSVPSWSKCVIGRYFEEDLKRLIWIKLETFRLKLVHALISIGQIFQK